MADKPDRNDPCYCGSGRKYKNCCLEKDESSVSSKMWIVGLGIIVILGLWFLATSLSEGEGQRDCPPGQSWSEAHQHCH